MLGVVWSGCWIAYGKYNTEKVPLTGQSRYAGGTASRACTSESRPPIQGPGIEEELESQVLSTPSEDPRYVRVRGILDRLLASAGLDFSPWTLQISNKR